MAQTKTFDKTGLFNSRCFSSMCIYPQELQDLLGESDVPVVDKAWLEDSVSKGRLLPTQSYLIS